MVARRSGTICRTFHPAEQSANIMTGHQAANILSKFTCSIAIDQNGYNRTARETLTLPPTKNNASLCVSHLCALFVTRVRDAATSIHIGVAGLLQECRTPKRTPGQHRRAMRTLGPSRVCECLGPGKAPLRDPPKKTPDEDQAAIRVIKRVRNNGDQRPITLLHAQRRNPAHW